MLNDKIIMALKPTGKPKKYADGGGLFLYISDTGSKLWRMAYRFNRKAKLLSFGEYPLVSLQAARLRRDEAKKLLAEGIDPAERKKAEVSTAKDDSFQSIALEWHERHTLHCTPDHRTRLLSGLNAHFFPAFGDKSITKIEAADIMAVVSPPGQTIPLRAGRRLLELCGQIFRYAIAAGRAKFDVTTELTGMLRPRQTGHRAAMLEAKQIGQVLLHLEKHQGYCPVQFGLRLIPLFFVNSSELRFAEWQEFDLAGGTWSIPADRSMTRHTHIVPLAKQAVRVLNDLNEYTGNGRLLFPSPRSRETPVDKSTFVAALRKRGYGNTKLSIHGFRAMAAFMLGELGYPREWIEAQLAHQGRSAKRGDFDHLQYLPERRRMMQAWADFLYAMRDRALHHK